MIGPCTTYAICTATAVSESSFYSTKACANQFSGHISLKPKAYYIEDCRISNYHSIQFITANTEDGFYHFVASKQNTSNGCAKSGSYLGQNLYEIALHGIFNMSYLTDSYIGFTLKMESVSKNTIFGLKMMVKSGLEKFILKSLHAGR